MNFNTMHKSSLVILFLICSSLFSTAQNIEVKVKKRKVSLNGEQIFKFERENNGNDIIIYRISDDEIFLKNIDMDNGTSSISDDYKKFIFMGSGKTLETTKFNGFSVKYLFRKLIKRKVVNEKGEINEEKLDQFIKEYDENITNRTMLVR